MKIYLHIGTHKTGTSSIQALCRHNQQALLDAGYYWPDTIDGTQKPHHEPLIKLINKGDEAKAKKEISQHIQTAQANSAHSLIYSSEAMSLMPLGTIKKLIDYFEDHEVYGVIFLRNIYGFVQSLIIQKTKRNSIKRKLTTIYDTLKDHTNYDTLINNWTEVLGNEKLSVLSYDQNKEDILRCFLSEIGLGEQAIKTLTIEEVYYNASLDTNTHMLLAGMGFYDVNLPFNKLSSTHIQSIHDHKVPNMYMPKIVEWIVNSLDVDFKHPTLSPIVETLTKPPASITHADVSSEANLQYIKALGIFCLKLYWQIKRKAFLKAIYYYKIRNKLLPHLRQKTPFIRNKIKK